MFGSLEPWTSLTHTSSSRVTQNQPKRLTYVSEDRQHSRSCLTELSLYLEWDECAGWVLGKRRVPPAGPTTVLTWVTSSHLHDSLERWSCPPGCKSSLNCQNGFGHPPHVCQHAHTGKKNSQPTGCNAERGQLQLLLLFLISFCLSSGVPLVWPFAQWSAASFSSFPALTANNLTLLSDL